MARTYQNPVNRGFFPDPSVIRVGDDYYMVNSSFQYFPAIPISHSRDMVNWHIIGHAVTENDFMDLSAIPDSHGVWAPDISYHDGKFYIFAALRLAGDGKRGNDVLRRQLVVWSEKPEGPYSKPAWLEVDTIDPSHFVDDDGQHYMIVPRAVNAVKISDDCTQVLGEVRPVWGGTGERASEGPHVMKKDGYYYAIAAEGGTGYGHGINIARSRELFGEYENSPYNPLMRQQDPEKLIQRAGHGKLVQTQKGDWWLYYLCGRQNGGRYTTVGRETAMDPVTVTEDGWFVCNGGKGPSEEQVAPDLPEHPWPKRTRDDFDSPVLGLEWEFVRNPDWGTFSLTERPGYARIWTRDGQLHEIRAKNTLLRREQELAYTAQTRLEFAPSRDGEQAGLTCYYATDTYVRLSVCWEGGRKLQLVLNRNHGEELVGEVDTLPEGPVSLRVQVEGQKRTFSYSMDEKTWHMVGVIKPCVFLCDEGVPEKRKRHTGTLVGIYANNGGCGSRIPADFDYFEYHDCFQ